jgi:hypothetical protein
MNVEKIIDRSWITKTRGTREYNDECSAFVAFAVSNCTTTDGKIRCPCKVCQNNHRHSADIVLEHLRVGRGIMVSYINWFMHGEMTVYNPDAASSSNPQPTDVVGAASAEHGDDMHTMLRDAFGIHEDMEPNREPEGVDQLGLRWVWKMLQKNQLKVGLRSTLTCLKKRRSQYMGVLSIANRVL